MASATRPVDKNSLIAFGFRLTGEGTIRISVTLLLGNAVGPGHMGTSRIKTKLLSAVCAIKWRFSNDT